MAQLNPDGLKLVFLLAEEFLEGASSALVLENNIFFGHGQSKLPATGDVYHTGGMVFGYRVTFTERYSVVAFDSEGKTREIIKNLRFCLRTTRSLVFISWTRPPESGCRVPSPYRGANWRSRTSCRCIWRRDSCVSGL